MNRAPRSPFFRGLGIALVVAALAIVPIRNWFLEPGPVVAGELFTPQHPLRFWLPLLHSWNETTDLGYSNVVLPAPPGIFWPYTSSYVLVPLALWSLIDMAAGPFTVGIVAVLSFGLPFWTIYWAAEKAFPRASVAPIGAVVSSLVYGLAPWTTYRLFSGPFLLSALAYSFIPVVWGAWLKATDAANERHGAAWRRYTALLVSSLFAFAVSLPHLLIPLALLLGGDVALALFSKQHRDFCAMLRTGAAASVAFALMAAFLVLPGLLFTDPARPPTQASLASLEYNQSNASLNRALALWGGGAVLTWQRFGGGPSEWVGWPLAAGALIGAITWRRRIGVVLFIVSATGIIASQGLSGLTGQIARFVFLEVPGFDIFRNAGKLLAISAFGYAILNGYLVSWLAKRPIFHGMMGRASIVLVAAALVALLALGNPSRWNGSIGGTFVSHQWPPEYDAADRKLQALGLQEARLLVLPSLRPGSEYSWHTARLDASVPNMVLGEMPLAAPLASDVGAFYSPSSSLSYRLGELLRRDVNAAEPLARDLRVGAIFVDPTLVTDSPGGIEAAALRTVLPQASWLKDVGEPELPTGTLYQTQLQYPLLSVTKTAQLVAGSRIAYDAAFRYEIGESDMARLSWQDFQRIRTLAMAERISLLFVDADRTDALGEALQGQFAVDLTRAVRWNADSTRDWVTYQGHPNMPGLASIPLNIAGLVMTDAPATLIANIPVRAPGRFRLLARVLFGPAKIGELQITAGGRSSIPLDLESESAALRWVDFGEIQIDGFKAPIQIANTRQGVALIDKLVLVPLSEAAITEDRIDKMIAKTPLRALYTQSELTLRLTQSEINEILVGDQRVQAAAPTKIPIASPLWEAAAIAAGFSQIADTNGHPILTTEGVDQEAPAAIASVTFRISSERGIGSLGVGLIGGLGNPRQNWAKLLVSDDGISWEQVGPEFLLNSELNGGLRRLDEYVHGRLQAWVRLEMTHHSNTFAAQLQAVRIEARPQGELEYAINLPAFLWNEPAWIRHEDGTLESLPIQSHGRTVLLDPTRIAGTRSLVVETGGDRRYSWPERDALAHRRSASEYILPPADEARFILFPQSYSGSWALNGQPPLHANGYMMAFWVDAGTASLRLRHAPDALYRWLLGLSAATCVACFWFMLKPPSLSRPLPRIFALRRHD